MAGWRYAMYPTNASPEGWRRHLEAKWRGEDVGPLPREESDQDALF